MFFSKKLKISPSQVIIVSSFSLILIGTFLFYLPITHAENLPFIDAFFTSVSLSTGTGLMSVSIRDFTPFGLTIIALITQISSLGLIFLTLFLLRKFYSNSHKTINQLSSELLGVDTKKKFRTTISFILKCTLAIELISSFILFFKVKLFFPPAKAFFYSVFHSIAAFSNIGISLFPGNMQLFQTDYTILLTLTALMLLGSVNFLTIKEIINNGSSYYKKNKISFSRPTIIILKTTGLLFVTSFLLIFILEYNNAFAKMDIITKIMNSFFLAISSMGTGMRTIHPNMMKIPTLLIIASIAYIGTSPGSTGSGIKTTTFAIFLATMRSIIYKKKQVTLSAKVIENSQINKAFVIIVFSMITIIITSLFLLITEKNIPFFDLLFESISAFSTLGISTETTPLLSNLGKIFISIAMFLGRFGPFTLIFALIENEL